ncbi:hypothetical protein GE09DRAFT_1263286 [Coniochaeta sp. 2T2.1]|nr:hypothetical protein GE09DRAFT_1263286 [Coniochaeta sp. 2T2.1]
MRSITGSGPFQIIEGNCSTDRKGEDISPDQAGLDADMLLDNTEIGDTSSLSDGDDIPRSPSPWQDACSQDDGLILWLHNGVNDDIQSSQGCASTSDNSETDSQAADPVEGVTTRPVGPASASASASGSGSGSPPATGLLVPDLTTVTTTGLVGSKRPIDERNPDDEDEDGPDPKRAKGTTAEPSFTRPRFACPYQKYDPLGSPFCCMPSSKNPQGGAETFPRVKSHIFRNHDPLVRCSNCWKMCKTEHDARMHRTVTDCTQRASPSKYWMTREQCVQVRQRRFVATNSIDNWYCLFGILLPNVPAQGPDGKKISPSSPQPNPSTLRSGLHQTPACDFFLL